MSKKTSDREFVIHEVIKVLHDNTSNVAEVARKIAEESFQKGYEYGYEIGFDDGKNSVVKSFNSFIPAPKNEK